MGDSNALIAVAIILLIVVIVYGSGCMSSETRTSAGTMVVQDKAVVTGPNNVAVTPMVTTTENPAAGTPPHSNFEYDPNKPPADTQVERLTVQDAADLISSSLNRGVGTARSLYKDIKIAPKEERDYLSTDKDIAKLFRPVERCCGERLAPNPIAEAIFRRAESEIDPSYYTGHRKRNSRKNYKKERFVDANGRWQSFMWWKVGCEPDPRPLAARVDAGRLPRVAVPENDVTQTRAERMSQKQKLERQRGYVPDQGMWVREGFLWSA